MLDGQRKPAVTACRATGIALRSDGATGTGFDARRAEGYTHEGRLIVADSRWVFIAPNPRPNPPGKNAALGLVCEANAQDGAFSSPVFLPKNALLISSRTRVLAIALHTGEAQQIGAVGSSIQPVVSVHSESPENAVEVWTATRKDIGTQLLRQLYAPGACLGIGTFLDPQSFDVTALIRTGSIATDGDVESSRSVWFLAVEENRSAEGFCLDPKDGSFKECGRHYDQCALTRTPPERATLWWSGSDSPNSNGEWFWISRGGWDDDGALPVQKMLRDQPKEIEYKAFRDTFSNRSACISLSKSRDTEMSQHAIDGAWIRTGEKVRWGWCGEEVVRLSSDPAPIGWSDEALMNEAGIRPVAEQIGPLVPTRWGFAAVVSERGVPGRPDAIAIVYFDFPTKLS